MAKTNETMKDRPAAKDPNNVTPDGISAEELHPEAEVGPSGPAEVEDAEAPEYLNVDDLPDRKGDA